MVHLRGVNLSLWTSLAIRIWWSYGLTCSLPPPPDLSISPSFHRGLYRRICASIVHPRAVNSCLWTSLAMRISWSYGLTGSLSSPLPPWPNGQRCLRLPHSTAEATDACPPTNAQCGTLPHRLRVFIGHIGTKLALLQMAAMGVRSIFAVEGSTKYLGCQGFSLARIFRGRLNPDSFVMCYF
jgi:hypothetical protein